MKTSDIILLQLAEESPCRYTPLATHTILIPNLRGYNPISQ